MTRVSDNMVFNSMASRILQKLRHFFIRLMCKNVFWLFAKTFLATDINVTILQIVHQPSICVASSLPSYETQKICICHRVRVTWITQPPKFWAENEVDTWRSLLMTTQASGFGWSFIPYQWQLETSLIVQFLNLWQTAYCWFDQLIIVFSCRQMQGWLHRGTCLLFLWSTALVCPIKMPSVHSISMLATYST